MQKLFVISAFSQNAEAVMRFGGCPKVKLSVPFYAAGLQGRWYTTHLDW